MECYQTAAGNGTPEKKHESGIRSQKCKLRVVTALESSSKRPVAEGLHVVGDLQPQ